MIRTASANELPAIRDLLERANDASYDIGKVAEEKCLGAGFEGQPQVRIHGDDGGEIAGFSTHEANNRGLGSFGPTGVRISARGRGLGRLLVAASLADLRRLGYHRAVIPWTAATEYYRKTCGARIAHQFVILRK